MPWTQSQMLALHRFWYGAEDVHAEDYEHLFARWYRGGPAFDREVKERFEPLLLQAVADEKAGKLGAWLLDLRSVHGLVLLLDQLSRNMYRGSAKMFETDPIAIGLVYQAIRDGGYERLAPIERLFMAVALEHSERLEDVERSAALMAELAKVAPAPQRRRFVSMCKYNADHLRVVRAFGRYPHRNALLNRQSTEEEEAFLKRTSYRWMRSVRTSGPG